MSSGNTNNTVFIQKLFTSRDNFVDGNTQEATSNTANFVGQAGRIWWDPARNNFYSSDGNTPGGILIGGGSGNGTVYGSNTWVQYNNSGNFGASPSFTFDSSTNVLSATYFSGDGGNLTNVNLTGAAAGNTTELQFNNNGNFSASGNLRFNTGSNTLYTDKVAIPTGTLLSGNAAIVYVIATLTLNQILANSDGTLTALPAGSYGNPNEVPAPWAVFQFTTTPSPKLEINDVLSGAGVPVPSDVVYIGTGGNSNVVVTSSTFYGLTTPVPTYGTLIPVARQTLNAGLAVTTSANTDIVLTPGSGGGIIWAGNLVPLTDDTFTLGSPTRRIKQAYFGSNTIYIYDTYLGIDQSIGANNGNLIINGGTGLTVGQFIMSGNTLYLDNPAEEFNIGTPGATGNLNINRPLTVSDSAGHKTFKVTSDGKVRIDTGAQPGNTPGAMLINGSISGTYPNVSNPGGMLHIVGNESNASRITLDAVGTFAGSGAYSVITSRISRGNYTTPTATQAGDTFLRLSGVGYGTTGYPVGGTTIELAASQTFTDSNAGSQINFYTTPLGNTGSNAKTLSAFITPKGLTLPNTSTRGTGTGTYNGNGGITFADDTYQNTAFNDTSAVTSVTVGLGLTQTATVGDVGIDATGVQSITGTANRIIVTDLGGQNFNISAPQDLNTSSTLTFANLTITGNLTVNGTTTTANSANLDSKVLYLAANSTSNSQINQGGIVLGNNSSSYKVSILYDLPNNAWNTDGAGLTTNNLLAANANIDFLNVQNGGHFGLINEQLDYPNAYVQVDSNVNSYSQIVSQNHSPGTSASSDLVLVNDIGNDGNHYIDMGINGSNYTDPAFNSTTANDGYLFINQGNLVIGTDTTGEVVKFVAGGTTSDNVHLTISETDTTIKGNVIVTDGDDNTIFQMKTDGNLIWGGGSQGISLNGGFYVSGVGSGDGLGNIITYNTSTGAMTYGPQLKDYSGNLKANNFTANTLAGNGAGLTNLNGANITGNINANLSGNGYQISNINSANIVGTVANANYAAYAGNVTHSLTINNSGTGSASGATFNGGSAVTISYNTVGAPKTDGTNATGTWGISITGNSNIANTANSVAGANVSGQVNYAAVANFVVGANVSGAVAYATTANAVAGANVSGTVANATYAVTAGTANSVAGANVTGAVAYATTANSVAGANVSGTVASATVAASANAVAGANVTGAVAFATTANSVAGANVSGQVSFAATANSVAGANVSGQVGNALVAGTVYTNSQPNITSVGTLTGFTSNGVVNFANTSNVTLGAVANLHISGGSANNILLTNGSGNLSWASISTVNGVGGNQLVFVLNAQQSIGNAKNTLLSLFGLTNGVTLASNTRYQYEILFNSQCSKAGVLSYALALGSGVAVAQHNYNVISNKTTAIDAYSAGITMMSQNATGAAITTAQTVADTATFTHNIIQGTIDVTTGGNVNFMVSQDQNTPVTWTINAGSYVRLMPLGAIGANTSAGTWS